MCAGGRSSGGLVRLPSLMTPHLPVLDPTILDRLDVESPCPADWERMRGDDRARFCGQCRQHVYDLSAMTRAEALTLIARNHGSLCVRLRRRPDGRVVTADCRERLRAARRRGLAPFVAALVLVGITQLGLRLFGLQLAWSWLQERPQPAPALMGEVAAQPPPPVEPVAEPALPVAEPVVMGLIQAPEPIKMGKIARQ